MMSLGFFHFIECLTRNGILSDHLILQVESIFHTGNIQALFSENAAPGI